MRYRPSIGIPLVIASIVTDIMFGQTGLIFAAVFTIMFAWSQT